MQLFTTLIQALLFVAVKPCHEWKNANDDDLFSLATSSSFGDPQSGKLCRIQDATTCTDCACPFYVKYSEDNGATWKGLSFQGTEDPEATGCPADGVGNGGTIAKAMAWLKTEYIQQGYCGCEGEQVCEFLCLSQDAIKAKSLF